MPMLVLTVIRYDNRGHENKRDHKILSKYKKCPEIL